MRRSGCILLVSLLLGAGNVAAAHPGGHGHPGRSHTHVGVYFGPSLGWSWYYPGPYAYSPYVYPPYGYPPYYYPYSPPLVVAPSAPPTYIERSPPEEQPAQPPVDDWYYCRKPEGYYPYVRECPGGWQRVPAQPQR